MFVRVKSTPNSPRQAVQIVQSVREGDKVRQKILRHVGVAMNDAELVKLKEVAEFVKSQLQEEELLSKVVFKHLSQAATWFDSVTSIPSLNFTPLMTLAR